MSVYEDVLLAVIDMAAAAKPYAPILIGALPADNGISITWASGAPRSAFFSRNAVVQMTAALNAKHAQQLCCCDVLGRIHHVLTWRKTYPEADAWQITDIATIGAPAYIGREQNNQWLYGSSLRVTFFYRGD